MPDLSYTFDKYTEKYQAEQLTRLRQFARDSDLPDRVSLEIGSNRARFLLRATRRWPNRFFIGVEKRSKYAKAGKQRLERNDVSNATLLEADVRHAVPIVFDDGQIRDVYVPFPDPWWKTRHRKRRVIRPDFLESLAPKMASGSGLWIKTDVGPFAEQMRDTLQACEHFERRAFEQIPDSSLPNSTREDHVIREGLPVHLVYFKRR